MRVSLVGLRAQSPATYVSIRLGTVGDRVASCVLTISMEYRNTLLVPTLFGIFVPYFLCFE